MNRPQGISIFQDFISAKEEFEICAFLDSQCWHGNGVEPNAELRRRTLQFGHLFLFKTRIVDPSTKERSIPSIFDFLIERLKEAGFFGRDDNFVNHIVVNEYELGQG